MRREVPLEGYYDDRRSGVKERGNSMNHLEKRQWIRLACCALVVLAAVLWLCGVFSGGNVRYHLRNRGSLGPLTRENIAYLDTAAPAATGKDGTVSASRRAPASVRPTIQAIPARAS